MPSYGTTTTTTLLCLLCLVFSRTARCWVQQQPRQQQQQQQQQPSRQEFVRSVATAILGGAASGSLLVPVLGAYADDDGGDVITLPNGVSYKVSKKGTGPHPKRGELAAIRFAAYSGETKIDDIFETPEPYYTRVGSGGLIAGVESVLPDMSVGDRWVLTIPGELAFGNKGRPASAGKPRIPAGQTIVFDVEMVGLPGREEELIELIGDY